MVLKTELFPLERIISELLQHCAILYGFFFLFLDQGCPLGCGPLLCHGLFGIGPHEWLARVCTHTHTHSSTCVTGGPAGSHVHAPQPTTCTSQAARVFIGPLLTQPSAPLLPLSQVIKSQKLGTAVLNVHNVVLFYYSFLKNIVKCPKPLGVGNCLHLCK